MGQDYYRLSFFLCSLCSKSTVPQTIILPQPLDTPKVDGAEDLTSVMVPDIDPGIRILPSLLDEFILRDIGYGPKLAINNLLEGLDKILFAFQSDIDTQIYGAKGFENNGGLNGLPLLGTTLQPKAETSGIANSNLKCIT